MRPTLHACPTCGRRVPPDAPANLCPHCLVTGGFSRTDSLAECQFLHRWDTRNRQDLGAIGPILRDSKAWAVSHCGGTLAIGWADGRIDVWNLETDRIEKSFTQTGAEIAHPAFSRDEVLLAVASRRTHGANDPATLRIWDVTSGTIAGTYADAFGPLAFSTDRQRLVSTRLDGSVAVWDLSSGRAIARIKENFTWIGGLSLSPDGRLLVTGSEEPVANVSDLASGKWVDSLKGSSMCVDRVAFAPDARTIASRTVDGEMKFWHAATGKEIFTHGPLDRVNSFLFSPNGEFLAVSRGAQNTGDRRMELWRAPSFEEIEAAEIKKAKAERRWIGRRRRSPTRHAR